MDYTTRFEGLRERAKEAKQQALEHPGLGRARSGVASGVRLILQVNPDEPITIERLLTRTVQLVRSDEDLGELNDKDVLKASIKRRRRLGTLALPGGPFAIHAVELYCDVATVCDLADRHDLKLTEEQIAAHMLTLWNLIPDVATAHAAMCRNEVTLTQHLTESAIDGTVELLPDKLTMRSAVSTISRVRKAMPEKMVPGRPRVRYTALPRQRTKRFIQDAEAQLLASSSSRSTDSGVPSIS